MNKLGINTPSTIHSSDSRSDISVRHPNVEGTRRLVILISPDSDCTTATRRIWDLAKETNSSVQLLGLCRDLDQELTLRRELATVSALIRAAKVPVDMRIEIGNNWLDVVQHNYEEGDMIVCIVDELVGFRKRPLSQIMESTLHAPIYILTEQRPHGIRTIGLSRVALWLGFVLIVVSFFMLQIRIIQLPQDGFQSLLLILLLIPEFWLIYAWNSLFS